jgi:hypothetical protein
LTVSIQAKIVSTKTSQELWKYTGTVVVDLGGGGSSGGSLTGLVVQAILTAVMTATADYVRYAKMANNRIVVTLPAGPYSPHYMKDQDFKLINQNSRRQ